MADTLETKIDALVNKITDLVDEMSNSRKFNSNTNNGNFSYRSIDLNNLEKEYQDLQDRIDLMKKGIKAWDEVSEKELKQRQEHIKRLQDIQEEENKAKEEHNKEIEDLNQKFDEKIKNWNDFIDRVNNDASKTQDEKDNYIRWAKANIEDEKQKLEDNLKDLVNIFEEKKKEFKRSRLKEKTNERNRQKSESDYENFRSKTKYARNKSKIEDLGKRGTHFSKLGEEMKGIKGLKGIGGIINKFGGGLTKATGALGKFAGPIGAAIAALELFGEVAKAIAETDAKAQEIQNRKNTAFTQHNIALSRIETEQLIDQFSTVAQAGINTLQTEGQLILQQQAIENKKFIAANQTRIGATIGNINDTAWQALESITDIRAEESKYNIQSEKERTKTMQSNAQLQSEMIGRTEKREQEKLMADYELNIEVSKANIEANRLAANHGLSYIANAVVNTETYDNGAKGGMIAEQQDKIGKVGGKDYSNRLDNTTGNSYTATYATIGALDFIPGVGNMVNAAVTKQETIIKRELTNIGNTLKSQQANTEQTVQKRDIVISKTNETMNVLRDNSAEIRKAAIDAATTVEKQYQKMAQTVEQWGLDFQKKAFDSGLSKGITDRRQLMQYANIMNKSVANIASKFGIKKEDIIAIQNAIQNNTGRNRIANGSELEKLTGLGRLLGDNNAASELVSNTEIFNTSIEDSVDMMAEMVKQVNKIGLDGRKYSKDMIKNLKLAQKYDFKNGVQGLYNMSKWAQNVRFNMDSLPSMLDDLQKGGLENAITKGAKLQVLGGKFAMGADPLAMLYESFMSPEDLTQRYNDMLGDMGTFNAETGKVDFNMLEQMQMRAFAEYAGQDLADVRNQATYQVKKTKVGNILNNSGLDEEQKQFAINQSYWDKNERTWKVKTLEGNSVNLSDINKDNITDIQPSSFEGKVESAMAKTIAWQDKMTGIQESQLATLILAIGGQDTLEKYQSERAKKGQEFFKTNLDELATKTEQEMKNATSAFTDFLLSKEFKSPQEIANEHLATLNHTAEFIQRDLSAIVAKMGLEDTTSLNSMLHSASLPDNSNELNVAIDGIKTSIDKLREYGFIKDFTDYGNPLWDVKKMKTLFGDEWKDHINYGQYTRDKIKEKYKNNLPVNNTSDISQSTSSEKTFKSKGGQIPEGAKGLYPNVDYILYQGVYNFTDSGINKLQQQGFKMVGDAILSSQNNSMLTAASKVTPINDGSVQLAKSDPKDTALFAKSGGPFDTLFNNIFGKINDIYNKLSIEPSISYINNENINTAELLDNPAIDISKINDILTQFTDIKSVKHNIDLSSLDKEFFSIDDDLKPNTNDTNLSTNIERIIHNNPYPIDIEKQSNNIMPRSMEYTMPLENGLNINNKETNNKYTSNNSKLQIDTVKVEINGKLELSGSNGQSIDIMNELRNNPLLLRELSQMLSENISKSINGGRATYDGLVATTRFNGMG